MHKDDDYARRQTTALQQPPAHSSQPQSQQLQQHNASPVSPAAISSAAGACSAAAAPSTDGASGATVTVVTAASITAVPCSSSDCADPTPLVPPHHAVAYGSEKSLHVVSEQQSRGLDASSSTAGIGIGISVAADRFGAAERSSSDRLPSGERYHGVSERYPLGQSVAAAVSSERLYYDHRVPPSRYYTGGTTSGVCSNHTPHSNSSTGTLDRYSSSAVVTPSDRYVTLDKDRCTSYHHQHAQPPQQHTPHHQATPHDSYSIAAAVDRYAAEQQQQQHQQQRLNGGGSVAGSYHHGSKTLPPEMYKYKDRKYYRYDQFADRFPPIPCPERFATGHYEHSSGGGATGVPYMEPPSPAPASDRFIPPPPLSPDNTPSPEVYPAANPFPSPTSHSGSSHTVDRFIPPPPLSPSPTENYSPKALQDASRQQQQQQAQHHHNHQQQRRYSSSPSPADLRYAQYIKTGYYGNERYPAATGLISSSSTPGDRYDQQHRYVPPNAHTPVERYVPQPQQQQQQPQPSAVATAAAVAAAGDVSFYNYQTAYDRYQKYAAAAAGATATNTDPYMRRDLQFHYRLPVPSASQYQYQQQQRARYRQKCCQYHLDGNGSGYQQLLSKSSPGSSSSNSSVSGSQKDAAHAASSLQDIQCQSYQLAYQQQQLLQQQQQQEKGVQCGYHVNGGGKEDNGNGYVVSTLRKSPAQSVVVASGALTVCRHGAMCASPSVEYVGASGGRHVCATPPPRGVMTAGDGTAACGGGEQCCARQRTQNSLTVAVWRTAPQAPQQPALQQSIAPPQQTTLSMPSTAVVSTHAPSSSAAGDQQQQQLSTPPLSASALAGSALSVASGGHDAVPAGDECGRSAEAMVAKKVVRMQQATVMGQDYGGGQQSTPLRAVSMPATVGDNKQLSRSPPMERRLNYTQSERTPRDRPRFARSTSTKDAITHYIKRETANFFGVDEDTELEKQQRWLDRRKRLATRTYGPLKTDYALPPTRERYTSTPWEQDPHQQYQHQQQQGPSSSGQAAGSGGGQQRPDVLPGPGTDDLLATDVDGGATQTHARQRRRNRVRRKDSVARMGWDGISYVVTTITRNKDRPRSSNQQWSRSFEPTLEIYEQSSRQSGGSPPTTGSRGSLAEERDREEEEETFFQRPAAPVSPALPPTGEALMEGMGGYGGIDGQLQGDRIDSPRYREETAGGWRRDRHRKDGRQLSPSHVGGERIPTPVLDDVLDNSNRRQYGMGWVGKVFGRSMKKHVVDDYHVKQQLDDLEDYRPMFTYWVTTVQILVLIISLICYGFGPYGFDLASRSGQALVNSLSVQEVEYTEPANFWWGPRAADLIHLGAKFAPCMRPDNKILQEIEKTRAKERDTACCIRNDDSGCVQSSKTDCSTTISTWKKWSQLESGPGGRISGSVCGLDPKFCDAPASVHPYEWPDDITKWPICRKTNTQFSVQKRNSSSSSTGLDTRDKLVAEHMVCEVIGHPCCIGIHGQCRITTHEYCDFVQGTFHDEASLCSQVSCLNNVCGMIPFYFVDAPDQIYRLWTSIFLHAGVLQLLLTLFIQYFLMRDVEKLTGSLRIAIIYMGSGMAGNLASAIFVPYRADVGPAGCQFGLLACLIVEVLNAWPMLQHPTKALCKLISITLALFLVGLLPWVDNYAHLFGFAFGFLISYALLPFVSFGPYDRQKKIVLIWVCLLSAVFLFVCLILLFYIIPVYDCKLCSYFNCLPFTQDFCASQNINFRREEPAV